VVFNAVLSVCRLDAARVRAHAAQMMNGAAQDACLFADIRFSVKPGCRM
jgi:hypothetical protein